jgi:hypothetical protein
VNCNKRLDGGEPNRLSIIIGAQVKALLCWICNLFLCIHLERGTSFNIYHEKQRLVSTSLPNAAKNRLISPMTRSSLSHHADRESRFFHSSQTRNFFITRVHFSLITMSHFFWREPAIFGTPAFQFYLKLFQNFLKIKRNKP